MIKVPGLRGPRLPTRPGCGGLQPLIPSPSPSKPQKALTVSLIFSMAEAGKSSPVPDEDLVSVCVCARAESGRVSAAGWGSIFSWPIL